MTLSEFKMWLQGYYDGGGNDIYPIIEKLNEVEETKAEISPISNQPWYPVDPWLTFGGTGVNSPSTNDQ